MRKTCHVLLAIDASGSMYELADDVRGGFNQYIDDLRDDSGTRYRITVALFNTDVWTLCRDVKPAAVPALDNTNYQPRGNTALHDAIGGLVTGFQLAHSDLADTDRVLCVVQTDGQENSSKEWRLGAVQKLIKGLDANDQWGFVFLGAGPTAWVQGGELGFRSSVQTVNTRAGTRGGYQGMTVGTVAFAAGASAQSVADSAAESSIEAEEKDRDR